MEEEKRNQWTELEIRGPIKNLSPELWKLTHLTALFLNDNNLQVYTVHPKLQSVVGSTQGSSSFFLGKKELSWV